MPHRFYPALSVGEAAALAGRTDAAAGLFRPGGVQSSLPGSLGKVGLWGAVLLALAGCDTPPEDTTKDDIAYFEEAVASIGCTLVNGPQYNTVQFQAGITREQALAMAGYELSTGRAERLESGGVRLIEGPCKPGAAPVVTAIAIDTSAK